MAFQVADRVKETSTTTGTGTLNLAGAEPGYQTFVSGVGTGNTTYYAIVNRATSEFEVGVGTVTDAAPDTLSRDTIISSSNSDLAVNFSAGTKDVICTLPSEKSYVLDDAGDTTISADLSVTSISGSGAGLTTLNASNVSSGTLPDARFPATLPNISGANLTTLNASNVSSGTLSNDRLDTVPTTKGGTGLTTIGSANQVLAVNGAGTDLEYQTISADITGVTAGSGLTGGGTTGTVTLNVGAGALIDVTADAVDVDLSELTDMTDAMVGTDEFVVLDASSQKRKAAQEINLSIFNNDLPGDIEGVTAGSGLTGGGTSGTVTLNVGAGTGIDVSADAVAVDVSDFMTNGANNRVVTATGTDAMNAEANMTFDGSVLSVTGNVNASSTFNGSGAGLTTLNASNVSSGTLPNARLSAVPNSALDNSSITINGTGVSLGGSINVGDITGVTAGDGLTGGGTTGAVTLNVGAGTLIDVAADTVSVDLSELTTSTSDADGDFFCVVDSVNAQKKLTKGNINISGFNNDAGYTTNVGDITGVTAGSGLTGGGASGSVTLNVGAGTGIDVAADTVSVDVSDFMTNGSNNRVLTATGTDAMNAEANMTFDGSTLAVTGAITATGDITAFFTSDETLKTNIENIQNPMEKVAQLNGVSYNWTDEAQAKYDHLNGDKEVGVIAQQVEKVLPEMVGTRDDGTKAVRYERMCALLIECVKDLQNQVNELKGAK